MRFILMFLIVVDDMVSCLFQSWIGDRMNLKLQLTDWLTDWKRLKTITNSRTQCRVQCIVINDDQLKPTLFSYDLYFLQIFLSLFIFYFYFHFKDIIPKLNRLDLRCNQNPFCSIYTNFWMNIQSKADVTFYLVKISLSCRVHIFTNTDFQYCCPSYSNLKFK